MILADNSFDGKEQHRLVVAGVWETASERVWLIVRLENRREHALL